MTVIPAYGRDYTSAHKVLEDWASGKDFIDSETGRFINLADHKRYAPDESVSIRYNKLRNKVTVGD